MHSTVPASVKKALLMAATTLLLASQALAVETVAQTPSTPPAVTSSSNAVATVNGKSIEAIDLMRAKKVLMSSQGIKQIQPEQEKELSKQALSQLVSAELLYQGGAKLEIKDIEQQIEEKLKQSKKQFPTPQDYENALKSLEMDENDIRSFTRRDIIISNFIEQTIASKAAVSEAESKEFYDKNPEKFQQQEAVRASHILIGVDAKATADDRKKAREKAENIRRDLATGGDFASLAKEHSTCPSSRQGGDLGYFEKGKMVPAFEQAAFALKPGELSDVIETQFGFHIIRTTDKRTAETVAFKDAKPRIEQFLKNQKVIAGVNSYLAEVRKNAAIEIFLK